jgi:site-specific DNA-cytosine methylase
MGGYKMNVLSLFDGMSCGQIALNRAGIKYDNYFASEIDKYAIQVTQRNYPNTIQLGDITKIKAADLPKIDLIIGGSPCQGFSFAGKQLAFDDPRSKLFFEFVRLKNETQPKYFLLENVNMKKKYQDVISEYLGVNPIKINSSLVTGALRDRLYWTNIPGVTIPNNKHITLNDIIDGNYYSTRDKAYCIDANYGKGTNFRRYFFMGSRQLVLEKNYTPVNMTKENANEIMRKDGNRWRKLTPNECEKLQTVPLDYTLSVPNVERYRMLGNGWTVDVIAYIFSYINQL